jgi:methyltransferase family protein
MTRQRRPAFDNQLAKALLAGLPDRYRYLMLRWIYRRHAVSATGGYDWRSQHHNRIELVNRLIAHLGSRQCRYLEIGCQRNLCFDSVMADVKIGVDPIKGGTHRMTSDEFFAQSEEIFDVIFIDGLHEFRQCRRDAMNGIARLKQGGFMLLHDLLPNSWEQEHAPRLSTVWTGDVWKTALELASTPGLTYRTVTIDHGVGVARKDAHSIAYTDRYAELSKARFADYLPLRANMNLCSFNEALSLFTNPS